MAEDRTLAKAREDFATDLAAGRETSCPCCLRKTKIYQRKVNSGMVRVLLVLYRLGGGRSRGWVHVSEIAKHVGVRGDGPDKLAYWHLTEAMDRRTFGENSAGYWRITELGVRFVLGEEKIPKYKRLYDGQVITTSTHDRISIVEAVGAEFDYAALMVGGG